MWAPSEQQHTTPDPRDEKMTVLATAAELNSYLTSGRVNGEFVTDGIIELKAGVNFGSIVLKGSEAFLSDDNPITFVTDADNPASLSGVKLYGAKNVTFDGIHFDYTHPTGKDVKKADFIVGTAADGLVPENITFLNCMFEGGTGGALDGKYDGYPAGTGLRVFDAINVKVIDCTFDSWFQAITFRGVSETEENGSIIKGNEVTNNSNDGIVVAASVFESSGLSIEENYLHDFATLPDLDSASDLHPDFIQVQSSNNTTVNGVRTHIEDTKPITNLTIKNNILDTGTTGQTWTQSIFIRNQAVDAYGAGDEMLYRDFLIEGNLIRNAHLHGITFGHVDGITVRQNTLLQNIEILDIADGDSPSKREFVPQINVGEGVSDLEIEQNILPAAFAWSGLSNSNLLIQRSDPDAAIAYYDDVFVNGTSDNSVAAPQITVVQGGPGDVVGLGADLAFLADIEAVTRNLSEDFNSIQGSNGDDTLLGSDEADLIHGNAGDDRIFAKDGDDQINGGTGNDNLQGQVGDDTINGEAGNDRIDGGTGADLVYGGEGNDTIAGRSGNDTIDGGAGGDKLTGGDNDDVITGGAGTDTLFGGSGNDSLDGGDNFDRLYGRDGDDTLSTGEGDGGDIDNLAYGGLGNDLIIGGTGKDRLYGEIGNDTLNGAAGDDLLNASVGNDLISGGAGNDRLIAGTGSDTLDGGADDDTLFGGDDNDMLNGGAGDDRIDGQNGSDVVTGGAGADSFIWAHGAASDGDADVITDLDFAEDWLIIRSFGDNPTAYVDSAAELYGLGFAGLTVTDQGSDTLLTVNEGATEHTLLLVGISDPFEQG